MKNVTRYLCAAGLLSVSGLAHAEGAAGHNASLTLNLPALTYASLQSKDKPDGGTEVDTKTGTLATSDLGASYAEISFGNVNLYFSPFAANKTVTASYMVVPDFVEVGLDLGLNSVNVDKPKSKDSSTLVGLMAWIYPKIGSLSSEVGLVLDSTTSTKTADATATATEVKVNQSKMKVQLAANLLVPLAKNFNYVGGIGYVSTTTKNTEAPKGTVNDGEFDVNIASFRLTIE